MTMKAVCDKIIVRILKDKDCNVTEGGIVLPISKQLPHSSGKIISMGSESTTELRVGDIILFHRNGGQVVMVDCEEEYRVLKSAEIYCKVKG